MSDFLSILNKDPFYYYSLCAWLSLALIIFFVLIIFKIPTYGRHAPKSGLLLNNRLGWFLMEVPTIILMPYFFFTGNLSPNSVTFCFFGLYMIHYINRTCIFPFRLRFKKHKIPFQIVISACFFNLCNTYFLGYYFGNLAQGYESTWFYSPCFITGIIIFLIGMYINQQSDYILINLRKNSQDDYKIPFGGLFRYISCPNHFGEMTEWIGFAILTWSFSGLAFALWTIANLLPRSIKHHNWYKNRFKEYPQERKAVLPYLL